MKAYRHDDGSVWTFRPERTPSGWCARRSGSRSRAAGRRTSSPRSTRWSSADQRWVPDAAGEKSLYLRPFMFASETFLGVRPAQHVTFMVIASPAGAYFKGGVKPVTLWLTEEYTRAGRGGMGAAKTGGNYASSLVAQQEAIEQGCDQVVFLDAQEGRYVEELGGMNIYFVHADGTIVTPETGTILEGITRASIIELAGKLGHQVEERKFSIDEWRDGVASGGITEVFACGTAAVVTPVGTLKWAAARRPGDGEHRPVTMQIRQALVDIQYGRAEDTFGWMHRVCWSDPRAAPRAIGSRSRRASGGTLVLGDHDPAPAPAAHPAPPDRRSGYRLLARSVRAAWAWSTSAGADGQRVALKVLRPHIIGDDEARERLAREVGSLRRVTSPGSPRSSTPTRGARSPYVATRYVPGLSLHQHVREDGPDRRRRPDAGSRPAWPRRWRAVHPAGVLHRDIKPSNVLMEGRTPVLIDFGLARVAERPPAHPHRLAARHAGLPRARDPLRRRRHHRLRRARLGRHRGVRRDRPAAVRHRPGDGDHGPGPPRRARPDRGPGRVLPLVVRASPPTPTTGRPPGRCWPSCG